MPLLQSSSRIHRVRAVVRGGDATAVHRRLERALRAADLAPAGLPDGALLCVRRLPDPLPGRLAAAEREAESNARWAQAARDSLGSILSTAARPRAGRLPARAEAVLFPSEADLLACFALAQVEGRLASEWWWTSALSASDLSRTWPELWNLHPAQIPAALQVLASGSNLPEVLRTLTSVAAGCLSRQLAVTYGLPGLLQVLAHPSTPVTAATPSVNPATWPPASPAPAPANPTSPEVAPRDFLPEITQLELAMIAALPVENVLFVLFALSLARNPARVRQAAFLPVARALLNGSRVLLRHTVPAPDSRPDAPPVNMPASAAPVPARALGMEAQDRPLAWSSRSPSEENSAPTPAPLLPAQAGTRGTSPLPPAARPVDESPSSPMPDTVIITAHGGVFYLLNLALALGLYGDFTQPLRPGLALSPWKFLGHLGRRLLRDRPGIDADPLWALLDRLAGDIPGEQPESWSGLANWQPEPAWTDEPLALPAEACTSGEGFLAWLIPVLTGRLDRAGIVLPALLGQSARVVLTAGRVDVCFSLSSHPIEIRLAGLDRDPGWIPAAGKDVRFHYD